MKLYGAAQSGGSLTAVSPGDRITLFDGNEAVAALLTSIAFTRAQGPGGVNSPITFTIDFAAAPTAVVLIQGSNIDVEADYQTLKTSTNTQHDNYIDIGSFTFYRAKISTYVAGGMPAVTAQR